MNNDAARRPVDDDQRAAAREIEWQFADELVDHLTSHMDRTSVSKVGGVQVENLEDGPADPNDAELVAIYERAAEEIQGDDGPIVYVDDSGRRYEVEVDVHVRCLPDVMTQMEAHDREVAEHDRIVAGQRSLLDAITPT